MADSKETKPASGKKRKPAAKPAAKKAATKSVAKPAKKAAVSKPGAATRAAHSPAAVSAAKNAEGLYERIALVAYLKAEARGFMPGFELDDWFAAEMELLNAAEHNELEPS